MWLLSTTSSSVAGIFHQTASRTFGRRTVTGEKSRALVLGTTVFWKNDKNDFGTVIAKDWSSVTVKWDSRASQTIMHNDMDSCTAA